MTRGRVNIGPFTQVLPQPVERWVESVVALDSSDARIAARARQLIGRARRRQIASVV
jgi:hypothetical protein